MCTMWQGLKELSAMNNNFTSVTVCLTKDVTLITSRAQEPSESPVPEPVVEFIVDWDLGVLEVIQNIRDVMVYTNVPLTCVGENIRILPTGEIQLVLRKVIFSKTDGHRLVREALTVLSPKQHGRNTIKEHDGNTKPCFETRAPGAT